jgi:membrane fusion protein (multidrug efflux system)
MDALTPDRSVTKADDHLPLPREAAPREAADARRETRRADEDITQGRDDEAGPNRDTPDDESEHRDDDKTGRPKQSWGSYFRARPWLIALIAAIAVGALVGGVLWWLHARQYETTDDAFIDARTVSISSQVSGAINQLNVTDNQVVRAGDVLARLDDSIYQAQLGQSSAQVEQAQANIANLDAQLDSQKSRIDQANKQVTEAQAALAFSQQEYARYMDLVKTGSGTEQRAQQASSDLTQKQAAFAGAQANATTAQKQLAVLETQRSAAGAQLKAMQAAERLAQTNVQYTIIKAPVDGRVTKLSGNVGTYLQPGQSIMMFVPAELWVTANFKETQLDYMRPGQPVAITIDAFPDRTFTGRVDSLQSGSGTAFSLLPAENATGNYIKVVQRIPVKIVFDQKPDIQLGPGMSVVPTVKVR